MVSLALSRNNGKSKSSLRYYGTNGG